MTRTATAVYDPYAPETLEQRTKREHQERTQAASDALVEHLLANHEWRGEIRHAIHGMPQGLESEAPTVVKRAVERLLKDGIPPMVTWARVAKRLLSQLGEQGDDYRRRCHQVALEEAPAGMYRAQGDHGQAWEGDWEPAAPVLPWWYHRTDALTLQGYSYGPAGPDAPAGEYAMVQRAGKPAVVVAIGE